jgi:hypothetical protein
MQRRALDGAAGKNSRRGTENQRDDALRHIESIEDRVDHFVKLREQQEKSGGFSASFPWRFIRRYAVGPLAWSIRRRLVKDDGRARLMLDNFDHIKAYWVISVNVSRKSRCITAPTISTARLPEGGELTTELLRRSEQRSEDE